MNFAWLKNQAAWQPFTFNGVAAFANASFKRLFLVQLFVALIASSTVVWFLNTRWFPTVYEAILQMPENGEIRNGRLTWTDYTPRVLAEGHYLAFIADLDHTGNVRVPTQMQVELGRSGIRFISLFGYFDWPYPSDAKWVFLCNRNDLQPWWGAWRPPLLWIAFGLVTLGLMLVWALLASIYAVPVWLVGFFGNRKLGIVGSWRLAGAAMMPGAAMVIGSVVLYGFGIFDLVQMFAIQAAHIVVGWVYCVTSALREPRLPERDPAAKEKNPFVPETPSASAANAEKKSDENPFSRPKE